MDIINSAISITIISFALFAYFAPTLIAQGRDHNNFVPIGLLNLFFGFTGIGWLLCLIWSTTGNVKRCPANPALREERR